MKLLNSSVGLCFFRCRIEMVGTRTFPRSHRWRCYFLPRGRLSRYSQAAMLILASASPRRRELLIQAGLAFTVESADINEDRLTHEIAAAYVQRLAEEKAQAIWNLRSSLDTREDPLHRPRRRHLCRQRRPHPGQAHQSSKMPTACCSFSADERTPS